MGDYVESILNFDLSVFMVMDKIIAVCPAMNFLAPYITWLGDGAFWPILGAVLLIPKKTRKIGVAMLLAALIRAPMNEFVKNIFCRTRPFALFNPEIAEKCIYGYTDAKGEFIEGWMKESYLTQVINEIKNYPTEFVDKWLANYHYPYEIGYHYSHGYAFPSGHTSSGFCVAFAMLFTCKGRWQKLMGWSAVFVSALVGFTRIYLHVHYCTDVFGGIALGLFCGILGWALAKPLYDKVIVKLEDKTSEYIKNKKAGAKV